MPGRVSYDFAPGPAYRGHWGVDFAVDDGTMVRAVSAGTVTFAGTVVDNLAVTVDHGGSVRTSYSFLSQIFVVAGTRVEAGDRLGRSGMAHGQPGLHFSLRVGSDYRDPLALLRCPAVPHPALRLLGRRAASTL